MAAVAAYEGPVEDGDLVWQSASSSEGWSLSVDGGGATQVEPSSVEDLAPGFDGGNVFEVDGGGDAELRYGTPLSAASPCRAPRPRLWVLAVVLVWRTRPRRNGNGTDAREPPRPLGPLGEPRARARGRRRGRWPWSWPPACSSRAVRPSIPSAGEAVAASLAPLAPPASADGSTAYCAGGTGSDGGAVHVVHLSNPGDEPVDVSVTVVPGAARGEAVTAAPEALAVDVAPGESVAVTLADVVDAPYLAAIVEAGPGELAVEHSVEGEADSSRRPVRLGVVADLAPRRRRHHPGRPRGAAALQPVPRRRRRRHLLHHARGPAGAHGLRRAHRPVAAAWSPSTSAPWCPATPTPRASITARAGRLVVDRLQRFDGSDGPAGLDLTPAAPSAALVWAFPDGAVDRGRVRGRHRLQPHRPGRRGRRRGGPGPVGGPRRNRIAVEPFQMSVAPLDFAQVEVHADGRVPAGRGHRITVRSQNGAGVVAERWFRGEEPSPSLTATLGSPVAANHWIGTLGDLGATGNGLVLANLGGEAVRAAITSPDPAVAAALAGLGEVEVPASGRVGVNLDDLADLELEGAGGVVVVVQATGPVVVERVLRFEAGSSRSFLLAGAATAVGAPRRGRGRLRPGGHGHLHQHVDRRRPRRPARRPRSRATTTAAPATTTTAPGLRPSGRPPPG